MLPVPNKKAPQKGAFLLPDTKCVRSFKAANRLQWQAQLNQARLKTSLVKPLMFFKKLAA